MRAEGGRGGERRELGRKFRSWLAIASLLIQLIATAAHFHSEDFVLGAAGDRLMTTALNAQDSAQAGGTQPAPARHADCELCASIFMMGAAQLPAPVPLVLPAELGSISAFIPAALRLAGAPYLLFQTRAPPIV